MKNEMKYWTLALTGFAMLVACSDKITDDPVPEPDDEELPTYVEIVKPERKAVKEDIVLSSKDKEVLAANLDFSIDIFKWMIANEDGFVENTVMSPMSWMYTVSMLANGAEGDTKSELLNLAFAGKNSYTEKDLNDLYSKLIPALYAADKSTTFSLANGMWFDKGVTPKAKFLNAIHDNYWAKWEQLDFENQKDALLTMNKWVSDNTSGMITNVKDKLLENEFVVLGNALYFESVWNKAVGFDNDHTSTEKFTCYDGQTRDVQMMHTAYDFDLYSNDECHAIDLGVGENDMYCMTFILPDKENGIASLMNNLSSDYLVNLLSNKESGWISVSLPKFNVEPQLYTTQNFFIEQNANNIFDKDNQNYSGISKDKFYIPGLVHTTSIEVNEEGVKAAGVTITGWEIGLPPTPIFDFNMNRPFIFLLREKTSGAILFMGMIKYPVWQEN